MENLSGAEIARFLSLRCDLLTVLLEIFQIIEEGQYILFESSQEHGMAFPEEAMQDSEENGSQWSMNGIDSDNSGDENDEHSKDGLKIINDDHGVDGGGIESENEDAPQWMMVHKDPPTRGNLGADSQTRIGDGEAGGPGQERGHEGGLGRAVSVVPNDEGGAATNGQVHGISNSKTTSEENLVRKSNNLDDRLQSSRDIEIRVEEFGGDVRPGECGGVISQGEGMPFWEEARQDAETMRKFNVDDKEGDGEMVESEQKGSASLMDGIVSVTSAGAEESENEDGPQLMDEGLVAIVENEQLPDDQNQYPTLQTASEWKPESLRSKRSAKWHKRK